MSLITHIQVPFCVGLLHPGKRWYYAGGQTGPFGDTLDAIRIETSAPEGEPLLEAVPTETALVLAALDNCEQYGGVIVEPEKPPVEPESDNHENQEGEVLQ